MCVSVYLVYHQLTVLPNIPSAVESWGYRFACECVAEVAARTLTAELPSYATVMELDRKVREFPIPEHSAQVASSVTSPVPTLPSDDLSIPETMSRFVMSNAREARTSRCFCAVDKQFIHRGVTQFCSIYIGVSLRRQSSRTLSIHSRVNMRRRSSSVIELLRLSCGPLVHSTQ